MAAEEGGDGQEVAGVRGTLGILPCPGCEYRDRGPLGTGEQLEAPPGRGGPAGQGKVAAILYLPHGGGAPTSPDTNGLNERVIAQRPSGASPPDCSGRVGGGSPVPGEGGQGGGTSR